MSPEDDDLLFRLLPAHHRAADEARGGPLKALLRLMRAEARQVEDGLWALYDDWFVETASAAALPLLGALVGWRPVDMGPAALDRTGVLSVRREIAESVGWRARKGTLALLEEVAQGVSGWPARAVEAYRRLTWLQHLDHRRLERGRLANIRAQEPLDRLGGGFDPFAHLPDVRRPQAARSPGRHSLTGVTLFLCRLPTFVLHRVLARRIEAAGAHAFTFSILGNDAPLFVVPEPEADEDDIAGETNLPVPLRRRAPAAARSRWYGPGRSLAIWAPGWRWAGPDGLIPAERIVAADLRDWRYAPPSGAVAVDPERGRLAFHEREAPRAAAEVRVRWSYGFGAPMGGGPYRRALAVPAATGARRRTVGRAAASGAQHRDIAAALAEPWEGPLLVEILDSDEYVEPLAIELQARQSLELRAAQGCRPLLRLLDRSASGLDALVIRGGEGARVVLDGLLIAGGAVRIEGPALEEGQAAPADADAVGDLCEVVIRDCTLVPGWDLDTDCEPRFAEPSLEIVDSRARVVIERSILGAVAVTANEALADPVELVVTDSILDATRSQRLALWGREAATASVRLEMRRSTVIGRAQVHAVALVEDSVLLGPLTVARRQQGCVRFSWLPPGSRAPRRFRAQPEAALEAIPPADTAARAAALARLAPRFLGLRYGRPNYARLADDNAAEILAGASDGGEMGAFHDQFAGPRHRRALARLLEHSPARAELGLVFLT